MPSQTTNSAADPQFDLAADAGGAPPVTIPSPSPHARAQACAAAGDYVTAAEMFAAAVARAPEDVDALIGHAGSLLGLGQYAAGEREIRRALRIAPNRADVHLQLGLALYKRATYSPAALAFRRTLELDPDSSNARILLGETLCHLGETSEAIEHLERVVAGEPSPRVFYALGLAFDRSGQPDRAAAMYRRSREDRN